MADKGAAEHLCRIARRLRHLPENPAYRDHRTGDLARRAGQLFEKNRLLQPDWEATWLHYRQVYTALFLRLGEIIPREHADYLYEAFRQLVRFVAEGKTDDIRRRIAQDLHGDLGDYLSLRGYAVPPWSAADVPGDPIEWSRLVGYNELREALRVSQNTLKDWLIDGVTPVAGRIRHKKAKSRSRKIQVVIADLPADTQARFRR